MPVLHRINSDLVSRTPYFCRVFLYGNIGFGFLLVHFLQIYLCMKKRWILWLIVVVVSHGAYADISNQEKQALEDLYESTNGPHWVRKWEMTSPVAQWYGVKVAGGHVVEINLFRNNLMGPLPESLGALKHLVVLNLAFNNITGELPATVTELNELQVLRLEMNRMKGKLPAEMGKMVSLKELTAFNNFFSGHIPESIGQITQLKTLNLSSNNLTGEIPATLGNLTSLESLGLFENSLYGEIPKEMGTLVHLKELVLANNKLGGEIPKEFGQLASLEVLQLQNNKFNSVKNLEMIDTKSFLVFDYDKVDERELKYGKFDATRVAETEFEEIDDN